MTELKKAEQMSQQGQQPTSRRPFRHEGIEVRKKDLLEATLEAVGELGVQGATVREIAKRAGVTPGLIRHYFDNKEQMFQAAYRYLNEAMSDAMYDATQDAARRGATSDSSKLAAYVRAGFRQPTTNPKNLTLWATFVSQVFVNPAIMAINRETYLRSRGKLEGFIERALIEDGRTPSQAELRALGIAIFGLIDGLWLEATMAAELFDPEELERIALISVGRLLNLDLTSNLSASP